MRPLEPILMRTRMLLGAALLTLAGASPASPAIVQPASSEPLSTAAAEAQRQLHETFTNLKFEAFQPSPVKGPIYQASAGGRIIYFAPQSEHLLFAAVYDKNGVNLTALAEGTETRRKLGAIDRAKALAIGPPNAPVVIEFTDPDCPYCQALERFWNAKAAEGKPVRRLVFFVSGIHPDAAAKAEHILCSPDGPAEFKAVYGGRKPEALRKCASGRAKVEADAALVGKVGITGTPTLIIDGQLISGFQQAELEAFLEKAKGDDVAKR